MKPEDVELSLRPKLVAVVLATVVSLLTVVSPIAATLAIALAEEQRGLSAILGKLNVNNEINLPAWYSASVLLMASLLLALIAAARRRLKLGDVPHWAMLSLIFLGLSADELASFHEVLIVPIRRRLDLHGAFYFAWVLPGLTFAAIVGAGYRRFLLRLDRRTRRLFLISAIVYLGGALGIEMVGGWLTEAVGQTDPRYIAATTLEELLEMAGMVLFVYSQLDYLARQPWRVSLAFGPPRGASEPVSPDSEWTPA